MAEHAAFSALDHVHMARALRLAERGRFTTKPNPVVGCVIARGETIVGEGWHVRAGEAHAEVIALRAAAERARGATVYVTLEPCGRHGRTPPCVDALIEAGVSRVVMAAEDAFQREGEGIARLSQAGVRVEAGLMHAAARELNRGFFSRIESGRPWIQVKLGMSADARTALADGRSQWITSAASRVDVMRLRAGSSAVLTGAGTARLDDPRLTVRFDPPVPFVPPLRVVLDPDLSTPAGSRVLDGEVPTLIVHAAAARVAPHHQAVERHVADRNDKGLDLHGVVGELARRGCNEVLVEAGATLAGAFVASELCDELVMYIAPKLLGGDARAAFTLPALASLADAADWSWHDVRRIGGDLRLVLRRQRSLP